MCYVYLTYPFKVIGSRLYRRFFFWLNPTCFVRQTGAMFAANFELSFTRVLVESVALRLLLLRRRLLIVLKNVYSMLTFTQPSF